MDFAAKVDSLCDYFVDSVNNKLDYASLYEVIFDERCPEILFYLAAQMNDPAIDILIVESEFSPDNIFDNAFRNMFYSREKDLEAYSGQFYLSERACWAVLNTSKSDACMYNLTKNSHTPGEVWLKAVAKLSLHMTTPHDIYVFSSHNVSLEDVKLFIKSGTLTPVKGKTVYREETNITLATLLKSENLDSEIVDFFVTDTTMFKSSSFKSVLLESDVLDSVQRSCLIRTLPLLDFTILDSREFTVKVILDERFDSSEIISLLSQIEDEDVVKNFVDIVESGEIDGRLSDLVSVWVSDDSLKSLPTDWARKMVSSSIGEALYVGGQVA